MINKKVLRTAACAVLLLLPLFAHAQMFISGLINAGTSVINNATTKLFTPDPSNIKGVDKEEKRRELEASIAHLPPDQQANARAQFERMLTASDNATEMQRQQAQAVKDRPLVDVGAIAGNVAGAAIQDKVFWTQSKAAVSMSKSGVDNNAILNSVYGVNTAPAASSVMPTATPPITGLPPAVPVNVATNPLANTAVGGFIGGFVSKLSSAVGASPEFTPAEIVGVSVKDGTREQVNAALAERGILATLAAGMRDTVIQLDKPSLPTAPSRVKIGFEPSSQKLAFYMYEYDQGGPATFKNLSEIMLKAYGQPTGQGEEKGMLTYTWKTGETEAFTLLQAGTGVAISYVNDARMTELAELAQAVRQPEEKPTLKSKKRARR